VEEAERDRQLLNVLKAANKVLDRSVPEGLVNSARIGALQAVLSVLGQMSGSEIATEIDKLQQKLV